MEDSVAALEQRIGTLLEKYHSLEREHERLQKRNHVITQERDNLQEKNVLACRKIETLILRLRDMENDNE